MLNQFTEENLRRLPVSIFWTPHPSRLYPSVQTAVCHQFS